MLPLLFPILGGLAGLVFLYVIGFRRFIGGDLILGLIIFFLALVIQSLIQPLLLVQIAFSASITFGKVVEYIIAQGLPLIILVSLWFGLVAATVQSFLKYIFVRGKSYVTSANIGAGFGLTEAFFVGLSGFIVQFIAVMGETPVSIIANVPLHYYPIASLERFSALLFHFGSTIYIFDSAKIGKWLQGLLVIIALHGLIDFLAAFSQLTGNPIAVVVTEITTLLVGVGLTLKFYKKAVMEREEVTPY